MLQTVGDLCIVEISGGSQNGEHHERDEIMNKTSRHPFPSIPLPLSTPTDVFDGPTTSIGKANSVLTSCSAILYLSTASKACALLRRDLTSSGLTSMTLVQSEMTPSKLESCL